MLRRDKLAFHPEFMRISAAMAICQLAKSRKTFAAVWQPENTHLF
jgi:hypothetical protein